ncbi:MAG: hypothetical protein DI534_13540 [Leifsonia xyli]|nr:MAG: hypothetical protein DI534_13540 [Leifsonia xyli]
MPDRPRIALGFGTELDAPDWERRHALGEVPSRLPYGLDGLTAVGELQLERLRQATAAEKLRARLGIPAPATPDDAVGVTWDENASARSVLTTRHAARVGGVIWLTDLAARGSEAVPSIRRLLRRMDALWVLSRAQHDPLIELVGADGPTVHTIRFGIDHRFFAAQPYPERPLVMSAGRDRDRDTATLFAALALVHLARPDADLVVQGAGDLPVPDGVRTLPRMPHAELRALYGRASVVALATHPNLHVSGMTVALEAMSTGRPVVATETPGFRDYVDDGRTGRLVPGADAGALSEAILAALEDPDAAARQGAAGRARVEAEFTTALLCEQIGRIARESLGTSRSMG